jgi:peptidyl-prolyl cis-trans isomerase A (cyclophilin A)
MILLISRSLRAFTFALALGLAAVGGSWAQAVPKVRLATSMGDIVLELYPDKAPKTVSNFLEYVGSKHYDGTVFHRVIDGFMIQGGGFGLDLTQKATRSPIPLEARNGLRNERGSIAMARTSAPDSATAQFFINVVDNANLNAPLPDGHGYAVFGKVIQGLEVVDRIRQVPVGNRGPFQNLPITPVTITTVRLINP